MADRWATPSEALTAAREFIVSMGVDEWVEEAHFSRDWPGGDQRYKPFWSVELRVMRVVRLGRRGFERDYQRRSLAVLEHAFEYDVPRYSKIDGRDWAAATR